MPAWAIIVIVLVVVVAVAAGIATAIMRQRRTAALRDRFGPEYERTVESRAGRRAGESELRGRERARAKLDIRPLPPATRLRYAEQWRVVQERFVDQPAETVGSADQLLHEVMAERGYPVGDFAAQSGLVSVDHPEAVENYRVAHAIYERADSGQVSTEELRDAMLRYRSLFGELLMGGQEADVASEPPPGSHDGRDSHDGEAPTGAVADEAATDEADVKGPVNGAQTVPAHRVAGDPMQVAGDPMQPEADHDSR